MSLKFGEKRIFRYSTKSKNNARWFTSTVSLIELRGVKHAVVFSMDITKDFNELLYARRNSEYDGLTMLYNRRKLSSMMENEYRKAKSCGVVFFDINGLKEINDNNGHYAGDVIIKIAADSIKYLETENVNGFRYGGDEFLIVVTNESEEYLNNIVQKLKDNIYYQNINSQYKCNIAIGTAYDDEYIDIEELISIADTQMYKEKKNLTIVDNQNEQSKKLNTLLKFLSSEYDSIYEINLKTDGLKLLESSKKLILNDIPLKGTYTNLVLDYFSKYAHSNISLNKYLLNEITKKLSEESSVTYEPNTISGQYIQLSYRCISYDSDNNPEIAILTIKVKD